MVDLKVESISLLQVISSFPKPGQVLCHFRDFARDRVSNGNNRIGRSLGKTLEHVRVSATKDDLTIHF